jgi:membrane-bound lytic murein transglycosylase A
MDMSNMNVSNLHWQWPESLKPSPTPVPATPAVMPAPEQLTLKETSFDQLPGWSHDAQGQAIIAVQRSCAQTLKRSPADNFGVGNFAGTVGPWQDVCEDLNEAVPLNDKQARVFFENHFTPYEMQGTNGADGLFTGYYEPTLHGSHRKHDRFIVPIYSRPNDLVNINLGAFKPDLAGEHIVGRVDKDNNVVPYYDREQIDEGVLKGKHEEIVYVDNAVDAFFLHIQGSGRIIMDDGTTVRVGYAAQNGQPYTAIGKALLERGALTKDNVSMQSIRAWLQAHPTEAADVMDIDRSYVFFRKLNGDNGPYDGPIGAQGVSLEPGRSLAVDKKMVPYGVPIWLDAQDPDGGANIQRLMVAQDTGGAIIGAVRGDFFWGSGDEAAHKAGLMKSKGHAWVLLPKGAAQDADLPDVRAPAEADDEADDQQILTTTVQQPAVMQQQAAQPAQQAQPDSTSAHMQQWYNHFVDAVHSNVTVTPATSSTLPQR